MFTFEFLTYDNGHLVHEEYTTELEIAYFVDTYYNLNADQVLELLEDSDGPIYFGQDDDHIWVQKLDKPVYLSEII